MSIIRSLSAGLIGLTVLLSGCSSAPTQVNANIPLVSGDSMRLADSKVYPVPQGNLSPGEMLQIGNEQYQIHNRYISASGLTCMSLRDLSNPANRRAICERDGQWQMLAPLLTQISAK